MHIFISAGEPSGDQHAAGLIAELKRRDLRVRVSAYGGPHIEQAGGTLLFPLTTLAVMGFLRVIPLLWKFISLYRRAKQFFRDERPDAVVLVDFPGFNWWIARAARAQGIPVFYYLPPQLWAWAGWRVRRMRKYVDRVLCGLPFEVEWYRRRGVQADFVGHPFFDAVADYPLDRHFVAETRFSGKRVLAVLPGSRTHEIENNWPLMMEVMRNLSARQEHVQFLVACYKTEHRQRCRRLLDAARLDLPVELYVGKTPEIIEAADCCLMVSGSVSLEVLARRKPAAVIYCLARIYAPCVALFLNVRSITLPNLIAGRIVLPEWIVSWQPKRAVHEITATLEGWLIDADCRLKKLAEVNALADEIVVTGATARTAEAILDHLGRLDQDVLQKAA